MHVLAGVGLRIHVCLSQVQLMMLVHHTLSNKALFHLNVFHQLGLFHRHLQRLPQFLN